ncbi:MAG: haloacid dehalogenase-like hydrolase [Solirubrobacteraceae bacterium]
MSSGPAAAPTGLLLLLDVDGTLVARATEAHSAALHQAVQEVHGIDARQLEHSIDPAGRTDGEIARLLLLLGAGVSALAIDERAQDVRGVCARIYAESCPPSLADKVLPGVVALLDWLAGLDQVRLALVTGNYEPVARLKLKRARIGHYFVSGQGGFGSDSEARAALPPLARRRAGEDGVPWPRAQTLIIGDTPRDIACARADDVRCFAVATGPHPAQELMDADAVATGAAQLRPLLEAALAA